MGIIKSVNTSGYYLSMWQNAELKLAAEQNTAGVTNAEEGDTKIQFRDRIKSLNELVEYWKAKYEEAYANENLGNKYGRMTTYNNGI